MTFDLDRLGGHRALGDLVGEVCAAGELALRLARDGAAGRARLKPDRSPVTEADEAVEARLRAFVARRFPEAAFLGEETGAGGRAGEDANVRFIVDPIDGTRAFVRGLDSWSILVGIEVDGEPVVGVALLPATGDLYVGVVGGGTTENGRPVQVSRVARLDEAAVSHGALSQFAESGTLDLLGRLARGTFAQRGFADVDGYRKLLQGKVDAMIDPGVKPWDLCAPAVLVRAAGGRLTSLAGADTIHAGNALASNALVHDALLALLTYHP